MNTITTNPRHPANALKPAMCLIPKQADQPTQQAKPLVQQATASIQKAPEHTINFDALRKATLKIKQLAFKPYMAFPIKGYLCCEPVKKGFTYGWRGKIFKRGRALHSTRHFHPGVDLPAPIGTTVVSVKPGRVIYAGRKVVTRELKNGKMHFVVHNKKSTYGKYVVVQHEDQTYSVYAHLSKINTKKGRRVEREEKVGEVGVTGRTNGPHLHFEVRLANWSPTNPVKLLTQGFAEHRKAQTQTAIARK